MKPQRDRRRGSSARAHETSPEGRLAQLRRSARESQERVLLDAAAELLARRGPDGFNVRDLARSVGASTTVIYTYFGGRDGVLAALCRDGLQRLGRELSRVVASDSYAYCDELAWTYRRFALANPQYYHAVSAASAGTPTLASMFRESEPFKLLVGVVSRFIDAGFFAPHDPHSIADALLSTIHGMVSLELAGCFPSEEIARERYLTAGRALLRGFQLGIQTTDAVETGSVAEPVSIPAETSRGKSRRAKPSPKAPKTPLRTSRPRSPRGRREA